MRSSGALFPFCSSLMKFHAQLSWNLVSYILRHLPHAPPWNRGNRKGDSERNSSPDPSGVPWQAIKVLKALPGPPLRTQTSSSLPCTDYLGSPKGRSGLFQASGPLHMLFSLPRNPFLFYFSFFLLFPYFIKMCYIF